MCCTSVLCTLYCKVMTVILHIYTTLYSDLLYVAFRQHVYINPLTPTVAIWVQP